MKSQSWSAWRRQGDPYAEAWFASMPTLEERPPDDSMPRDERGRTVDVGDVPYDAAKIMVEYIVSREQSEIVLSLGQLGIGRPESMQKGVNCAD